MKKLTLIIVAILILSGITNGQGTVIDTTFYSKSLGTTPFVKIYLPEGYDIKDTTRYPVIYYLHGFGKDHNGHAFIIDSLDALIETQRIEPVILVKPDGSAGSLQHWDQVGSYYANSELIGQFEDYIVFDLVDFIDTHYKTNANCDKRCIMGHSMGAMGAMALALKHPDIYSGVASHSGLLDYTFFKDLVPYVLNENGSSPPYSFNPNAGFLTLSMFRFAASYSPNLANLPYQVDFLLNNQGNLVDRVWTKWLKYDPITLATALPPDANLRYILIVLDRTNITILITTSVLQILSQDWV